MNVEGTRAPDKLPPIEELLPHRGTMLLLDRVTEFAGGCLVAEYSPRPGAWYADASGNMSGWIGIELMAQAVAAHVAMNKRQAGLAPKIGALLGTRSYQMSPGLAGSFAAGQLLRICVQEEFRDESGLAAYDCSIVQNGKTLATTMLKIYEPDDFELFVKGSAL